MSHTFSMIHTQPVTLLYGLALSCFLASGSACSKGASQASEYRCDQDSDCQVSCTLPYDCCGEICGCSKVYHVDHLKLIESRNKSACSSEDRNACPVAGCARPTQRTVATCEERKCVGKLEPYDKEPTSGDYPAGNK